MRACLLPSPGLRQQSSCFPHRSWRKIAVTPIDPGSMSVIDSMTMSAPDRSRVRGAKPTNGQVDAPRFGHLYSVSGRFDFFGSELPLRSSNNGMAPGGTTRAWAGAEVGDGSPA